MSALQKTIMKNKLPPKVPRTSGISKLAPFGAARRKDYTPVSWKLYFEKYVDVETEGGSFRVYVSPEPDHPQRPRIVTLHGGGYSGLSWALFTEEITNMIHCQVVSMDVRGHGETKAKDSEDLSIETMVKDVEQVLYKLYGDEMPPLILLGHSMGGAIAVRAAHSQLLSHYVHGVAVIDVVEGTAMDSLASMQSFLRSRPTHFKSIEHAIEWCVRSGQVRNVESARVSMPSQIINCTTNELATSEVEEYESVGASIEPGIRGVGDAIAEEGEGDTHFAKPAPMDGAMSPTKMYEDDKMPGIESAIRGMRADSIPEEDEGDGDMEEPTLHFVQPVTGEKKNMRYRWRVELSKSERHWAGWFRGLSSAFLTAPAPRLLLLASVDGLDRELTVGQMQGKFQMQVLTRCGHAVHEDSPGEVARVLASFALRHRLTETTECGERMQLISAPGC